MLALVTNSRAIIVVIIALAFAGTAVEIVDGDLLVSIIVGAAVAAVVAGVGTRVLGKKPN